MRSSAPKRSAPLLGLLLVGCSTTTTISVQPKDARIFVDDEAVGTGIATTEIGDGLGGSYKVRVEKPGLQGMEVEVARQHLGWGHAAVGVGGCLGGGCLGAGCGYLTIFALAPFNFTAAERQPYALTGALGCAALLGLPFNLLWLWAFHGPDAITIDLEQRTVKASPDTDVKILPGRAPSAAAPQVPAEAQPAPEPAKPPAEAQPPAKAAPAENAQPDDDTKMQPFDY